MITIADVVRYLDTTFHPEYQEDYDNSGFLVGCSHEECLGVLVALDMSEEVLAEAKALGANLIITHHPLIFKGIKSITNSDALGRLLIDLLRSHVAVYAAHTNLDNLPWGVNGALCEKLGLTNTHILQPSPLNSQPSAEVGAGMVGELPTTLSIREFLEQVKQITGLPMVRYAGGKEEVRRVAVCGGAGSFLIDDALTAGADIYLTADLKYHDFQRATDQMTLADIGHYESEQFAKDIIYRAISKKFSNFACRISEKQGSLVSYI